MFLETERNLRDNPHSSLYYLEAPTGSGKTNMSVNLFLTMLEEQPDLSNVFYIFPFNTLVEQTAGTLEQYFEYGREMAVVNSITPIYVEKKHNSGVDEEEDPDYEKAALNKLFVNYPLVVTSHVHFFNALFGTSREQCFALGKLCNSVVIIDEIQSYRNAIWQPIILFLLQYASLLNMKIIIMSATLPKLHVLLESPDQLDACIKDLLKDPQTYYQNPLFKNRVELDFSMLDGKKTDLHVLRDNVLRYKDKKVLVEFISKTTAREFYNLLRQADDVYCVEITGDDNVRNRKKIIADIQSRSRIIVVATQVIEAGVDIDMDVGFKDVSLPDAEEQFLGRINRSCRKIGSKAYFFNYDDARKIYRDDQRVDYPVTLPYIATLLKNKDFAGIYEGILRDVKMQGTARTREHIQYLHQACLEQNYRMIEEKMRLISPTYSIFLAHGLKTEEGVISGQGIWQRYKALSVDKTLGYGEKQVRLSELAEAMSYFTYTVYSIGEQRLLCDEEFGGYYYIENGDIFIEDGKFNRKAFSNHSKGLFL
jgi:CRISPR-associated endonuclease/helicase Cas3